MEHEIETLLDGRCLSWWVGGDFNWGNGGALCPADGYPLDPALGPSGFKVVSSPLAFALQARQAVADLLGLNPEALQHYHRHVDDGSHFAFIQRSRELRFDDLSINPDVIVQLCENRLGVRLSAIVPMLGRDHVQLRINRPRTTDYNPPHRDGALTLWRNSVNIWFPIAGVNEKTSLPILPGSHRIAEEDCWQTKPGSATIESKPYRVPAIANLRGGPLRMIRAPVRFGEMLLFTPFLIHGLAVNETSNTTRMALEFRLEILP